MFGWVRFRNGDYIYKTKYFQDAFIIKIFPGFHLSGEVSPAQCGGVGEQDRLKVSVSFDRWGTKTIIIAISTSTPPSLFFIF